MRDWKLCYTEYMSGNQSKHGIEKLGVPSPDDQEPKKQLLPEWVWGVGMLVGLILLGDAALEADKISATRAGVQFTGAFVSFTAAFLAGII